MSNLHTTSELKVSPLNIRIRQEQRYLIEKAAKILDKTVSDFVRDAALRDAENTLLDRTNFYLEAEAWELFNSALNKPPVNNAGLRNLMMRKPVWEK
ncbi:MAG TPA: DUF1778 domain-containing protein [Thiolinea sp.]|nr:DUF1778 domain-containing protein [Thiolinea sp.]